MTSKMVFLARVYFSPAALLLNIGVLNMDRRLFLSALASLPLLNATASLAQPATVVQVTAQPGVRAVVRAGRGEGFLLEVSGFNIGMPPSAQFNIGMPPADSLGNFEIQDLMSREITVRIGTNLGNFEIQDFMAGRYRRGNTRGTLAMEISGRNPASGFLMIVASAAAAFGAEALGQGGSGQIGIGETRTGFLLEVSG